MNLTDENNRRKARIYAKYNPISGEACCGDRKLLEVNDSPYKRLYLPTEMWENEIIKLLAQYKLTKLAFEMFNKQHDICFENFTNELYLQFWVGFNELRIKYDFEFFAYVYIRIRDKISSKDIPFKLNRGQRKLLNELEKMRKANVPIRIILLKARQWGGSTLIQLYMFWIQLVHRENWNSVICAHVKDASITIRSMFERAIDDMIPINNVLFRIKNYQGTQNIKEVPERGCLITVGTAIEPESVRSQDAKMAHFSEIAFYPNTDKNKTEDLITSIVGSIPREPLTMIAFESTANGVGDFFYNEWEKAKKGETAYSWVFVPWFMIDIYKEEFNGEYYNLSGKKVQGNEDDFARSLTEYEINLWNNEPDITLENLNWYRGKQAEMPSTAKMKQEYPSNDIEAWQDSGQPAFKADDVERMRKDCGIPVCVGYLRANESAAHAKLNPDKRKGVLHNIEFEVDEDATIAVKGSDPKLRERKENNRLKIWQMPEKDLNITNRYVVVYDPAKGVSDKADWGVIAVFDRYWMMYGGVPEIVAEWRGHEDKDIAIWIACQVATFYDNALLVVESNTFESGERYDDNEFIFDQLVDYYRNLYYRTPADKIVEGVPVKYGFHTNKSTKPMIVDGFVSVLRERAYKERNAEALNEARWYERNAKGVFGAKEGKHDDILMTRMIGCHICYELPLPKEIKEGGRNIIKKNISEASF